MPAVFSMPIGGSGGGADDPDEIRTKLRERESNWRAAHPEHARDAPVPAEAKRRDVVWRALERKLERVTDASNGGGEVA